MPSLWYRKRRKRWYYDTVDANGKPRSLSVGKTKAEALEAIRDLEAVLATATESREAMTVEVLAEEWLALRAQDPDVRDKATEAGHIRNHVVREFGSMVATDITRGMVLAWVGRLSRDPKRRKTARNIHSTFRVFFGWLHEEREAIPSNPAVLGRGKLPTVPATARFEHRRRENFPREEMRRLLDDEEIARYRRVMYALAFYTGARRSEAVALRWNDIEVVGPLNRIVICRTYDHDTTKTEVPRPIPLHPRLADLLRWWYASGFEAFLRRSPRMDDPIVPRERTGAAWSPDMLSRWVQRDLESLKLRHRGVHAIRRAFASLAAADGVPDSVIRKILHTTERDVTEGYTQPGWEELCRGIVKLDLYRPQDRPEAVQSVFSGVNVVVPTGIEPVLPA